MGETAEEVSPIGLVDTKRAPVCEAMELGGSVQASGCCRDSEPGSSVSMVAPRHDLNTNQLFNGAMAAGDAAEDAAPGGGREAEGVTRGGAGGTRASPFTRHL